MLRTHTCGELRASHQGQAISLCGWVDSRRDHGGLIFIDLRDRYGKTQLVFNPSQKSLLVQAEKLRSEFALLIHGKVEHRPAGTENPKIPTGEIEIHVSELKILSESPTPPFLIEDDADISEEIRLKYRFLDIRRKKMADRLVARYQISKVARDYLDNQGFIEVETPYLTKSTPEGARDYLVPARLAPGMFYALPQSPQLFKQILMISGVDSYFQLARCFRDEDLRADRQPEHTQIDIEMSFIEEDDIHRLIEGMLVRVWKKILNLDIKAPFLRLDFEEALNQYGSDKPDMRYDLLIQDVSKIFEKTGFKVFQDSLAKGGVIKGIKVSGKNFSRKELDDLTEYVKGLGAKGLVWIKVKSAGEKSLESPVAKFFSEAETGGLVSAFSAKDGDTLFLATDHWEPCCLILGELRKKLANDLSLIAKNEFKFLWVVNFPLLEYNEEEKRWQARHHPFTSPKESDVPFLESDPGKVKARAYDLVLNGTEIGGGSVRIHAEKMQEAMFRTLGITKADAEARFGFFLNALKYGAPPHGGIAIGLDRLTAMILGLDSIRDVIAFPKTQKGTCLTSDAPSTVSPRQLKELHIGIRT